MPGVICFDFCAQAQYLRFECCLVFLLKGKGWFSLYICDICESRFTQQACLSQLLSLQSSVEGMPIAHIVFPSSRTNMPLLMSGGTIPPRTGNLCIGVDLRAPLISSCFHSRVCPVPSRVHCWQRLGHSSKLSKNRERGMRYATHCHLHLILVLS